MKGGKSKREAAGKEKEGELQPRGGEVNIVG